MHVYGTGANETVHLIEIDTVNKGRDLINDALPQQHFTIIRES